MVVRGQRRRRARQQGIQQGSDLANRKLLLVFHGLHARSIGQHDAYRRVGDFNAVAGQSHGVRADREMREIVFLQHVQGFDDLTKNGTDRGEAQRLAGLREILAQRHAGIELRDHQRHLAHVLKLQHLREMGVVGNRQHGGRRIDVLQSLAVVDDKKLAIPGKHVIACLPNLQAGFLAQWRDQHIAVADGISQLRFHGFLQLCNDCSTYAVILGRRFRRYFAQVYRWGWPFRQT